MSVGSGRVGASPDEGKCPRLKEILSAFNAQKGRAMDDHTAEPEAFVSLYRRAFAEYGIQALWNKRLLAEPTREDALVVARALRIEGDREARRLAEQIEQACRAAL